MSAAHDHVLAGAGPGTLERPAPGDGGGIPDASRTPRLLWLTCYAGAGVVLFLCYLRISATAAVTSDGASNALQAWDILHGNWLLRGWTLSDVSFYTTELPEYVLVEIFRGLSPADVHICGAITYTLLVVLAGLLAKGGKTGKEGLISVLIASGIMIAPQAGQGAFVLLLSPDHTGTGVPLLVIFLLLDRAPRRWWVPAAVGLLLAWAQIGDPVVILLGAVPIVAVCAVRGYRGIVQRREPLAAHWFDLALAASAIVSVGAAEAAVRIIRSLGGYKVVPLNTVFAPSGSWPAHLSLSVDGILHLYGAGFSGSALRLPAALAVLHLAGVALAAWATAVVIRRFPGCDDMIAQILAVGIVVNVTAYAPGHPLRQPRDRLRAAVRRGPGRAGTRRAAHPREAAAGAGGGGLRLSAGTRPRSHPAAGARRQPGTRQVARRPPPHHGPGQLRRRRQHHPRQPRHHPADGAGLPPALGRSREALRGTSLGLQSRTSTGIATGRSWSGPRTSCTRSANAPA